MDDLSTAVLDIPSTAAWEPAPAPRLTAETFRRVAWEISEQKPADGFTPPVSHVGLAMVGPVEGFAHWRILPGWIADTAWHKGEAWRDCRLILRLYDVSYLHFNGLNAHRIQDEPLPAIEGQRFFRLPNPGTWQLAEVGFLLRQGEFVPAARSHVCPFAPDGASRHASQAALLVDHRRRVEEVGNLWDQ